MSFLIREVRESDAESTAALLNSVIEEGKYTIVVKPFTVDEKLDFIRQIMESGVYHVAVAEDDRTVVGIQLVLPYSTMASLRYVGDIGTYVTASSHRSGMGRALSEATFNLAEQRGFYKIMAMIRGDNPRSQAVYGS